jgi:SnoaL-like domain
VASNGSKYVAVVVVVLAGYFTYQWWFNPRRAIARRLGNLAATLSIPPSESEFDRVARLAQLRPFFTEGVRIRGGRDRGELTSREAVLGAAAAWPTPPGGATVAFVDAQVEMTDAASARVYAAVEVTARDARTGEITADSRDCSIRLVKEDAQWKISEAEVKEPPPRTP